MKKAYYLLFYKIYSFFKSISDDGWADWKSYVIIGGSQGLLIVEFYVWCDIIFKNRNIEFSNPYKVVIPLAIFIAVINYYIFLQDDKWREYEEEFKNYTKKKSSIVGWLSFLFLIGVLSSLVFAFYQMSLIDWSKYR